ncbi:MULTISPECIES: 3-hydroxyacyl-ACP dehydratase FabZ family protein [unclassified Nocardia]|uniref:3-hydroxyacyl-ACP dehydratase FabZ family protein n=1 Tax=unclassified Nocardia TaxID=2637762 RepID=UPI00278C76B3|nr:MULTISPECIES: hypothetical protein [unclassified Nocardia]
MTPPLLDRVETTEPGRRAVALVNVPMTMPVFDTHFPRFPVLPGVLLLDRVYAVATLIAPPGLVRPVLLRGARFRRYIEPGDQIRITVAATEAAADRFDCQAVAEVDGRRAATVALLRLGPSTEDFHD